mmetsp:Transcript_49745/g.125031  ORF Transcript_49745/g.125031 Transcript_49745/m.125031 type:complete len:300 (+) Transcript_49745:62-961(+)
MILLEFNNRLIEDFFKDKLENPREETLDVTFADFDGVQYHISTPEASKTVVTLSLSWRCAGECLANGGTEMLQQVYGAFQTQTEDKYDVTLRIDLAAVPGGEKAQLPLKLSNLKRNLLAAVFKKVFTACNSGSTSKDVITINYREGEALYIRPEGDRVICLFAVKFKDAGDQILAKVFLQEFQDARRTISNAPSVQYSINEPPNEFQNIPGIISGENLSFVAVVLFQNHLAQQNQDRTINNVQNFRNYLHYHIKCSKGYMHERMRNRVDNMLQVLNRARPEPFKAKEKKVMSGRTFVRK